MSLRFAGSRAIAAFLAVCLAAASVLGDESPGPVVVPIPVARDGTPVVVSAPGAHRVRGPVGPWVLPRGSSGDEFVLPPFESAGSPEIEVDRGQGASLERISFERLPPRGPGAKPVVAMLGARGGAASGARVEIQVPADSPGRRGLSLREGWLWADDVAGEVGAAPDALSAFRALAADGGLALEPLVWSPDALPFRAADDAAARAPHLPPELSRLGWLVAIATLAVAFAVRRRGAGPAVRAAWTAGPAILATAWLLVGGRLPQGVRSTAIVIDLPHSRLVLLRIEARDAQDVVVSLPSGATGTALLRFGADDRTTRDAEVGADCRISLNAGGVRLLAWREVRSDACVAAPQTTFASTGTGGNAQAGAVPASTAAWLRLISIEAGGLVRDDPAASLPRSVAGGPVLVSLHVSGVPGVVPAAGAGSSERK